MSSTDGEPPTEPTRLAEGRLLRDWPAEHVARLTICNPAKRNALDQAILEAIAAAVSELDARCLILTGADAVFSAGHDIGALSERASAEEAERLVVRPFAGAIAALQGYRYPTIAALSGHAIGAGLELALACDLRIAATGSKVGMPPAKLGLVYSHTGLQTFLDTIGAARTRELFLLGRNIAVEQALDWGLVNWAVAPQQLEPAALELAQEIAANAPLSVRGNKRVLSELLTGRGALDAVTEQEMAELHVSCFASEEFREGLRAFLEKRPPRWQGH